VNDPDGRQCLGEAIARGGAAVRAAAFNDDDLVVEFLSAEKPVDGSDRSID